MKPLLELHGLQVHRDGAKVLQIDRLEVQTGEVLAIVGPNGAGKSTLFLALARLLKTQGGEILFNGRSLDEMDTLNYRRRIALVLQEALLLDSSVKENVALGLKFRGLPAREIEQRVSLWLERLDIAHLEARPTRRLSGGEAQRVSLARAFVLQPELLLLDEPFTSLDSPTRTRLLDDLKSVLGETRTTTIFITHDLDEALKLATCLAVILEGKIHQIGPPRQVFASPANVQVAEFLGR